VAILALLLSALRPLPVYADGHAVTVTSPAPASLTAELYTPRDPRAHEDAEKQVRAFLAANLGK
jgi:hypothetical protein